MKARRLHQSCTVLLCRNRTSPPPSRQEHSRCFCPLGRIDYCHRPSHSYELLKQQHGDNREWLWLEYTIYAQLVMGSNPSKVHGGDKKSIRPELRRSLGKLTPRPRTGINYLKYKRKPENAWIVDGEGFTPVYRNRYTCTPISLKVSFHSRSQGSQVSQQACVCDAYWHGNTVGTHFAKFGEGLQCSQSSRTCSTFATTHKIRRVVARYGNKKRRFAMLLCFGGTVLVLLFYVRGSKVWHAQSRNPLEMLVGTSSAHFPYLPNKGGSHRRQLRPEWKPQYRSGKNSQEVATPTCYEPCELLWKRTLSWQRLY